MSRNRHRVYPLFARHLYFPLDRWRKQIDYAPILAEALGNQRRPREELERLQLTKLRALLAHADAHCPFYRRRFREAGLAPADVTDIDAFRKLPLLEKHDVASSRDELSSQVFHGRVFKGSTSGTTGIALIARHDSLHQGWVDAIQERGQAWWGLTDTDRSVVVWGRPLGSRWLELRAGLAYRLRNKLNYNSFELMDDGFFERVLRGVRRFRPALLYGYGSSLGAFARFLDERGIALGPEDAPRVVQFTADQMYDAEQEIGRRVFGAPVVGVYGSVEGGGTAQPCAQGNQHMSVDHILTEFLRPDGTPAAPDESAEIVITTLNNYAMPLIRYRVGDTGSWNARECPCGVTLPLMNLDVGKVVDLITTSKKERVSAYVLDFTSRYLSRIGVKGIAQFLVEQVGIDEFVVHIVKQEPFDPRSTEIFVASMKEHLGEQIRIELRFVDHVPVTHSGKRRWFKKSMPAEAAP